MLFFNLIVLTALLVTIEGVFGITVDPGSCSINQRLTLLTALAEVYQIANVAVNCTQALKTLGPSQCRHATVFNTFQVYFRNGYLDARGDIVYGKFFCCCHNNTLRKLTDYNVGFIQGLADSFYRVATRVTIFCNDAMWTQDPNSGLWYCKYF